jgi:hemoglobin/transferrin/lactoferrin receptor protein
MSPISVSPRFLSAAIAAILLMLSAPASAADSPEAHAQRGDCADNPAACLDTIQVTATKRPESTLDVPTATTVVGPAALAEAAMQTPMDALHGAVGTFVQQTTPGQGVVIVRGLKGSEVLHLVDGFRLNNAIFRNAPNQYIALVDGQSLSRIEVVRGPSGTLYGGDAMGGVVQMLTPELETGSDDVRYGGRLRMIAGSADDSVVARAEVRAAGRGLGVQLGVTSQEVNDLRVGGGTTLRPTGFTQRSGDFKLQADPADGHRLTFSLQYSEQPRTPRFDALVPGFGQTRPDNALFFFEPQQRRFGLLHWRIDRPSAWFDTADVRLGHQRIVDDRRSRETATVNLERERNRVDTEGVVAQFGKAIGDHHYLSYGMEFYRDEVESSRLRTNIGTGAVSVRQPRFPDGARMDGWGVYLIDDWRRGPIDINYGLRYSRYDIEIPAAGVAPGVRLRPDDLTGSIGLAYALNDETRLVANLGRGFRAPNIFDLGVFGPRPGKRFSDPNPQLKPETVLSVDLGLKFGGERFSGEAIAFRSRYNDKITQVLTGEVRGGALVVQNRNVVQLDLWGVEAGARYRFDAPQLELYATATWTRGEEDAGDGNGIYPADRIPPLFGKLGALWRVSDAWTLEAYTHYASAQERLSPRDQVDPRVNPNGTGGWATLNARVGWRVSPRLTLSLRAENLADKRYREHGSGLDEPGRNILVGADVSF